METPPLAGWTGRQAVELYVRTYTTMLQSSGDIKIDSLVHAHLSMASVLHPLAAEPQVDMGALLYAVRRLPSAIVRCRRVLMGQSPQGFRAVFGADITSWQAVKAPPRRRRWYHSGDTLAVLIASPSDIDDLVPTLVAYQIEWNKLHGLLQDVPLKDNDARRASGAGEGDWERLRQAWGDDFDANLAAIKRDECRIVIRLIGGSHLGYARNASRWWQPIESAMDEMGLREAPIYFVSSNTHSLVNVLTGVAREFEQDILDFVRVNDPDLNDERRKLEAGHSRASRYNWLYYGARQLFDLHPDRSRLRARRAEIETANGIRHVPARGTGVDSAAQVFKISQLDPAAIDPRVGPVDEARLRASNACIVNRDYLDMYYQGRYTVVELEAGPYLDACFEINQPDRYPLGESVNMAKLGFDLGIVFYASDTPYTQARTLGARGLRYRGMDSTYAAAIALARRILQREEALPARPMG